jgi:hypothetical protein
MKNQRHGEKEKKSARLINKNHHQRIQEQKSELGAPVQTADP